MVTPFDFQQYLIILASTSPRRQELLRILGLPFQVITPTDVDETPQPNETPAALVQRLSRLKAEAVAAHLSESNSALPSSLTTSRQLILIAADTEVALGNCILGKPDSIAAATEMLKNLRQQPHHVYSGLTVALFSTVETTFVTRLHQSTAWMRPYTDAEIAAYVASGDPLDKAGAYGIQNKSFAPVECLKGCFASVMGLPLGELAATFRELALPCPEIALPCSQYNNSPCCQSDE